MIKPRALQSDWPGPSASCCRPLASRWARILPGVLAAGAAVLLGGCGKPMVVAQGPETSRPAPARGPAGRRRRCSRGGRFRHSAHRAAGAALWRLRRRARSARSRPASTIAAPTAPSPCAAPSVCDFLGGRCVPPEARCVLTGTPAACGTSEFPPRCGPGSRCDARQGCVPEAGCRRVVCDASNFCRGADCPQLGGGGVQSLALEPIAEVAAGDRRRRRPARHRDRPTASAGSPSPSSCARTSSSTSAPTTTAASGACRWRARPVRFVSETQPIGGVTADRSGTLYYTLQDSGTIRRVPPTAAGAAAVTSPSDRCRRGTYGLARMTFGPDGQLYAVADRSVHRFAAGGAVDADLDRSPRAPSSPASSSIATARCWWASTGPTLWRLPPGGAAFEQLPRRHPDRARPRRWPPGTRA